MPYYIFQGAHDNNTPSALVQAYYDAIEAPDKDLIWFEHSAHGPLREEPEIVQKTAARKGCCNGYELQCARGQAGPETGGDAATAAVSAHFGPEWAGTRPAADRRKTALQAVEAAQCGFFGAAAAAWGGTSVCLDVDDAYRAAVTGLGGRRQLFLGNVPGHGDGDTVLQREYSGAGGGTQAAADAPFVDNGFHNASSFW